MTTGCYRDWSHSSCSCVLSKAHAEDSLLCLIIQRKLTYCLLQSREIQNSGLETSSLFFFPQVSGFQLFLPVAVSGMLTHLKFLGIFITLGQIIIKIVDSCMKRRENASSWFSIFFPNFHSYLCSQIISYCASHFLHPIFQLYGLRMSYINSTPVKTSTCPCVLLPGAFCVATAFTHVHVVLNPLLFPF